MITCPKCSKENQDHYKFCLGCGAELPRNASSQPKSFTAPTPPSAPPTPDARIRAPASSSALPWPPTHRSARFESSFVKPATSTVRALALIGQGGAARFAPALAG